MATNEDLKTSSPTNNASLMASMAAETNTKPKAQDDQIAGEHMGTVYITPASLLANDTDINGDAIRGVSLQNPVNGEVYWDGQQVVFVPTAGYSGPASFEYSITDDNGGYDNATVKLTIAANTAPEAVDDSVEGYADTDIVIPATMLLSNDSDADGDTLTGVSLQDAVNGAVSWDGENVTFRPDEGYEGPASFSYTVVDDQGASSTATVNLTIVADTGVNNTAPEAQDDDLAVAINETIYISPQTLLANDSDIDGDRIEGISIQDAVNGVVSWDGTNVIFTPEAHYAGPASFTYTISDSHGATDTATVNLNIIRSVSAELDAVDNKIFSTVDGEMEIPAMYLVADDYGDDLQVSSVQDALNGTVRLDAAGAVFFTPAAGYIGTASFTYTVQDGSGATDTALVEIEVQSPNEIITQLNGKPITSGENQTYTIDHLDSIDRISPTNSFIYNQENVQVTRESPSGYVQTHLQADAGFSGIASFDYIQSERQLNADTGLYEQGTGSWFRMGTAKFIVSDGTTVDVAQDDTVIGTIGQTSFISVDTLFANDSFVGNEHWHIVNVTSIDGAQTHWDGEQVIYSPYIYAENGFTYTIVNTQGELSTATVTVQFEAAAGAKTPDEAIFDANEDFIVAKVNGAVEIDSEILTKDDKGNSLQIVSVEEAVHGSVSLSDDGRVIFNPDAGYQGHAEFKYTLQDENGWQDQTVVQLDIQSPDEVSIESGVGVSEVLLRGSSGGSGATNMKVGDAETIENGKVYTEYRGDYFPYQVLAVAPDDGYVGTISFDYTYNSNKYQGQIYKTTTTIATANVNVIENLAPVTAEDTLIGLKDSDLVTPSSVLLANDLDPEGRTLTVQSVQDAVNGVVKFDNGNAVFTPDTGFIGNASYSYTAVDDRGNTQTQTVNLMVKGTSNLTLTDQSELNALDEGTVINIASGAEQSLLSNTNDSSALITGFTIGDNPTVYTANEWHRMPNSFEGKSLAGHQIKINNDGSYGYSIGGQYSDGHDYYGDLPTIHYTVHSQGQSVESSLHLSVNPVNDNPVVKEMSSGQVRVTSNETTQIITTADEIINQFVTDVDHDTLSIASVQLAENGVVALVGNDIYFTPDEGYTGAASFEYTVVDNNGGVAYGTFRLNAVDAPVLELSDDQVYAGQRESIVIPLSSLTLNDDFIGINNIAYANQNVNLLDGVQDAVNGSVEISGNNIIFTPEASYTGPASFTYTMTNRGVTQTATVNLHIEEPADATVIAKDDIYSSESTANTFRIEASTLFSNDQLDAGGVSLTAFNTQGVSVVRDLPSMWSSFNGFKVTKEALDGPYAFDYVVNDGVGNIAIATVDLNVGANQAPVATGETLYVTSDVATIPFQYLLGNDTDPEHDLINLVSTQNAVGGVVSANQNQVSFTLDGSDNAPSFQYSIDDSRGHYDFAQVDVIKQEDGNFNGTDGRDIMYSNADDNVINAGAGDDVIKGGAGNDTITGGLGADTFVWSIDDAEQGANSVDRILDFDLGADTLEIKDLIDYSAEQPYQAGKHRLDAMLDFKVEGGNTEISVRHAPGEEVVQTIILEGVALEPTTFNPTFPSAMDSRILYNNEDSFIYQ